MHNSLCKKFQLHVEMHYVPSPSIPLTLTRERERDGENLNMGVCVYNWIGIRIRMINFSGNHFQGPLIKRMNSFFGIFFFCNWKLIMKAIVGEITIVFAKVGLGAN